MGHNPKENPLRNKV